MVSQICHMRTEGGGGGGGGKGALLLSAKKTQKCECWLRDKPFSGGLSVHTFKHALQRLIDLRASQGCRQTCRSSN